MPGGGPHSQHGRIPSVAAAGPPAWNHLQVPPFYAGRQPQHAHMSSEHHMLARPPTWHTPSTENVTPLFSLQQMLGTERTTNLAYSRPPAASVDLSLPPRSTHSPRNGSNHNGESSSPISLSVRDAKQINSLAERRAQSFQELVNPKRPKRVDSILERLNTGSGSVIVSAAQSSHDESSNSSQPGNVLPTSPLTRDEEVISPASNEDSLDSTKSRRKRKPSKTVRMSKEESEKHSDGEEVQDKNLLNLTKTDSVVSAAHNVENKSVEEEAERLQAPIQTSIIQSVPMECDDPLPQRIEQPVIVNPRGASVEIPDDESSNHSTSSSTPNKTRRKTLSESETIENIAAMIASTEPEAIEPEPIKSPSPEDSGFKVNLENVLASPPPVDEENHDLKINSHEPKSDDSIIVLNKNNDVDTKLTPPETNFVEVETQLEKMFADDMDVESGIQNDPLLNQLSNEREHVTSTSSELNESTPTKRKSTRSRRNSKINIRRSSEGNSNDSSTPTKKSNKSFDEALLNALNKTKISKVNSNQKVKSVDKNIIPQKIKLKNEIVQKDVYAYDSGSNASSARSRGPFIQIRGPRDSPISVNIVNTPSTDLDADAEKAQRTKTTKKSFHDDSEYRNKVRSKGLHSSTLSIKYDAHTTDTSWICVFCKRGPHTTGNDLINHHQGPSTSNQNTGVGTLVGYSSGDLFGPYIITSDCPEYQQSLEQLNDLKLKVSLSKNETISGKFSNKKAKRRHLQSWSSNGSSSMQMQDTIESRHTSMEGMLESGEPNRYEIWAHEDCIVWGPGVYLAGPRIVGLEGAVWNCCSVVCEICNRRGASVSCLVRNCRLVAHVGCAKLSGWCLDEDTYKAYCQRHKKVS